MFSRLFGWIFPSGRRNKRDLAGKQAPDRDELLSRLKQKIDSGKERLERFYITRSVEQGVIRKEKNWSLTRTARGLYRIDSPHISVMIHTSPFLSKKNGKLTGVIRINETALCRLLHAKKGPLDMILASDDLEPEILREVGESVIRDLPERTLPGIHDLVYLEDFDLHRILSLSGSHLVAHLLLNLEEEVIRTIISLQSMGALESLLLELDGLVGGGYTDPGIHSRLYSLQNTDQACLRVREILADHYATERRKKERLERQKQLSGKPVV